MSRALVPLPLLLLLACHAQAVPATPTSTSTSTSKSPSLAASLRDAELGASPPTPTAAAAEACFEDPLCTLDEASRRFLAADEASAPDLDCFRFYYGTGVPEDPARARRCFERDVGKSSCGGSSPDLESLYLATMRLDAQGGPRDAGGARALLKDCFQDVSVTGVLDAKRVTGPIDFCKEIGGTTLSMQGCALIDGRRAAFEQQRAVKALFTTLDDAGKALYGTATKAFALYSEADSTRAGDVYRGGTLRTQIEVQHGTALLARRAKRLADRRSFSPATAADLKALEGKLTALRDRLRSATDADGKALLDATEAAWRTYLAAEVAFYTKALNADPVAVRAGLARDRMAALK